MVINYKKNEKKHEKFYVQHQNINVHIAQDIYIQI